MNETDLIKSADLFDTIPEEYRFGLDGVTRHDVTFVEVPLMQTLVERGVTRETEPQLYDLLDVLPDGAVIAGGFVSNLLGGRGDAGDIDLFFTDAADKDLPAQVFEKTVAVLRKLGYAILTSEARNQNGDLVKGEPLDRCPVVEFAAPLKSYSQLGLQCIKISWFRDAEDLLDGFDFTCIQAAIDVGGERIVLNPLAGFDFSAKRLVQHQVECRKSIENRIVKYRRKGFRPPVPLKTSSDTEEVVG